MYRRGGDTYPDVGALVGRFSLDHGGDANLEGRGADSRRLLRGVPREVRESSQEQRMLVLVARESREQLSLLSVGNVEHLTCPNINLFTRKSRSHLGLTRGNEAKVDRS